tara:strand:+ start:216 stop:467 length:252 start_codon:yes stop_codon:yes gene_type:complete
VFEIYTASVILIDKGLLQAAQKELKKALKLTENYVLFELQTMLLGSEKRIQSTQTNKKGYKTISSETIKSKEKHCFEQLTNVY